MAVRGAERLGGMADRAVLHDGCQQLEQRIADLGAALLAGLDCVTKV